MTAAATLSPLGSQRLVFCARALTPHERTLLHHDEDVGDLLGTLPGSPGFPAQRY